MDVEEVLKLKLIKEIGLTHAKVIDGLSTLLCLSGMLSGMYLAAKQSDNF